MEFMVTKFIDSVMKCFKDNGYSHIKENEESGGVFLVGYDKRLFRIDSDFQVGESYTEYEAIGCGYHLAMGALYALSGYDITPHDKINTALSAADKFSSGVSPPFVFERI